LTRCRRFLARVDRLDGILEVYHKCGAMNRLAGLIDQCPTGRPADWDGDR
jgi:hypothetical protein